MKINNLVTFLFVISVETVSAQSATNSPLKINLKPKTSFSFTKKWDYPGDIIKDDEGKFHKTTDGEITAADTMHLNFTADCKTNIQGGYHVNYCTAKKKGDHITLIFSGGFPAYANEFKVVIDKGRIYFQPTIIYPDMTQNMHTQYRVTLSNLELNQSNYKVAKVISGYINAEFTESIASKKANKYYFKGYFKTNIN